MNNLSKIILLFLLIVITPEKSFSSSCGALDPASAREKASMIFSGDIESIKHISPKDKRFEDQANDYSKCGSKIVTFNVNKIWKGDLAKKVEVFSAD